MRLAFIDILSLQLVIVPVIILLMLSLFAIQSCRRTRLLPSSVRVSTDHVLVYSLSHCFASNSPYLLVFFLLVSSLRGFEGFYFLSQMYMTSWHLKFFFFCFFSTLAGLSLFMWSRFRSTSHYMSEICVSLTWLLWTFFWILSVCGVVIFLFFLEILGLLLILTILYVSIVSNVGGLTNLNAKLFNFSYSFKLSLVQSVLFFLWSSALSMLLLFWSCAQFGLLLLTSELSLLELFYNFSTYFSLGGNNHGVILFTCLVFFFAIMLKTAIAPAQLWVVTFYKNLSLDALFTYFIFYYLYFIVVVTSLIFGYFYALIPVWYTLVLLLLVLTVCHTVLNLTEVVTLRGFFAYSSIINIFVMFIYNLSSANI